MGQIIKVNDKEIGMDTSSLQTLSDLIEALLHGPLGQSELIKSIELDDNCIDNALFESAGSTPIANCENISITTIADPIAAVLELIKRMGSYLTSFSGGLNDVADRFRAGGIEEANSMLVLVIEGLQSLTELVETVKELSKSDLGYIKIGEEDLSSCEGSLSEILKSIHDGQEAKDWVIVADLLEYELAPSVDQWQEILPVLSDKLKEETGQ